MCVRSSFSQGWRLLSILILGACSGAFAQGTGYWHTSGNQIIDSSGHPVRVAGINWYGFETTSQVVHGLWAQDYRTILKAIKNNGYNVIRLPYSSQMVESPIIPSNISYSNSSGAINTDLKGLNALQVMDKVISATGALGLRVILDNHRSEAGNSAEANGLWYTGAYPESAWINDWKMLVNRYSGYNDASGNPTVIAVDLRNEPHLIANGSHTGSCWTGDTALGGCPTTNSSQNWPAAAQRAGNAILSANANMLIIVEGTDCYNGDCGWWGGNLESVASHPVALSVSNRLVYSAHDYGPKLYQQNWFNGDTSYSSLSSVWNKFWAYINANHTAPVMIGEFGTDNNASDIQSATPGSQGQWFESLVNFLQNNPSLSWTYWALNGEDSYGLLDNQYDSTPVSSLKQSELASIQSALSGGGGGSNGGTCSVAPTAPSGLAALAISSSQINLTWTPVTPPSNCSITYSVFRSTAGGFTPSLSNQIASGLPTTSFGNTGLAAATTYYYKVEALDASGSSSASIQASETTQQSTSSGLACHVAYIIVNQWNTGFQAAITIENIGAVNITSWTLRWTFPGNQRITNLWNGSYLQGSSTVMVNNLSYNGPIQAGGKYNGVGFTANFSGTNAPPVSFSVNGTICH